MMYVVLAAGISARMGFDKVFEPLRGLSPLARIAQTLGVRCSIVVVRSSRTANARALMPCAQIVVNDDSQRGMTHSLRLALANIPADEAFGVILGDMPYLSGDLLDELEACGGDDADVIFPVRPDGAPGHPVLFSARARAIVAALPDGDTLRSARDHVSLRRVTLVREDRDAFLDLDEPDQWRVADA